MLAYLALLFFAYLISHFFQTGHYLSTTQEMAEFDFIWSQVFEMLMFYVLVVVFEMFDKNIQFSRRQTVISFLLFVAIGGLLMNPELRVEVVQDKYLISFAQSNIITLCQLLFNFIAGIWLTWMLYKSRKTATSKKQKHIIFYLTIGLFMAVFLPSLPNVFRETFQPIVSLPEGITIQMVTAFLENITQSAGMLIIGYAFIKISKHPWLLQRQKIHWLLVYSRDGIDLFSKPFSSELTAEDMTLITGGFSAIAALFQEATKTPGDIQSILLEGKELRLIAREQFICALLVDYNTQASELAHHRFADEFESRFKKELNEFKGQVSEFYPAKEIALKYFS